MGLIRGWVIAIPKLVQYYTVHDVCVTLKHMMLPMLSLSAIVAWLLFNTDAKDGSVQNVELCKNCAWCVMCASGRLQRRILLRRCFKGDENYEHSRRLLVELKDENSKVISRVLPRIAAALGQT